MIEELVDRESLQVDPFADWSYYNHENIRIFYPPEHPHRDSFESIAAGYLTAMAGITSALKMELPTDTITILFYPDYQTGMEMTGEDYQYVDGNRFHFWLPGYYGVTLTQWLLPRWQDGPVRHRFLRHGLITLFDHSGQDYHVATLRFIDENRFLPLSELAVDSTINSNRERYQSTEAASFCAFIMAWYGPEVLQAMYRYPEDFETFVRGAFDLSVDSLELLWLEVIRGSQVDTTGGS